MSPRKFDRFMVDVHIAAHPKLSRLNAPERWCFVGGILSLAALAPVRGRLLIGNHRVEPEDVAVHARVSVAVARATMTKLRAVGMLVLDPELDCEAVHDFEEWNPPPKNDPTNAERQRRYRDRMRNAHNGAVTPVTPAAVTPPEVEVEVEEKKSPPLPPQGGRGRDRSRYEQELASWAGQHFPSVPPGLVAHHASQLRLRRIEPTVDVLRPLIEENVA